MRFSRVTLVACLMVLLAILLASPSSGETSNRIESKKMVFDEEANPDNMTTDVERKSIKADKKADDKEEKSDVKSKKTDGESKMTDGESKKTDGESKKTGGKSKKSKKDKKSKKAEKAKPNGSSKVKSKKKSPVNPTGNDKRISSFDASSIAGFVSSVTCGELKLNTFKDVDVTRCLCDDKSCPCVMSSRFPCMCTNCEPTPPGGDFFNCLGCSCLEFP